MANVYEFTVKDRKGNDVNLGEYAGKVLLIVNTATGCGFTPHYDPLEAMYRELRDRDSRSWTSRATSSRTRPRAPKMRSIPSAP